MARSYDSIMADKSFLPYRMDYLTDWMVKKAEEELGETDETRTQALKKLRILIAKEKNLDIWTDDSYLLQFLRARKFEPEKAMELIHNFYTLVKDNSDIYPKDLNLELADSLFESNIGGAYPYRHKDGGVVLFISIPKWDPEKLPVETAITSSTGMALLVAEDPATQVCGVHVVYEAAFKLSHLPVISLRHIKLYSKLLRNTMPVRFNSVHFVNESIVFRYIFSVLKIFLSEKIKNRIHFHGSNMKQLHKYIPKEILPPQYGGDNINYCASDFCKKHFSPNLGRYRDMLRKGYI